MKNEKKNAPSKNGSKIVVSGSQTLPAPIGYEVNLNIPTHFANIANIMASSDGMVLMSFITRIPGHNIETCRVSIPQHITLKMVDIICQQLNYYPQRSDQSMPEEKKKTNIRPKK